MARVRMFDYETKELFGELNDGSADHLELGDRFKDQYDNLLRVMEIKHDILTDNKDLFNNSSILLLGSEAKL